MLLASSITGHLLCGFTVAFCILDLNTSFSDIEEDDTLAIEAEEEAGEDRILPVNEQQEGMKGGRNKGRSQRKKGKWNKKLTKKR